MEDTSFSRTELLSERGNGD